MLLLHPTLNTCPCSASGCLVQDEPQRGNQEQVKTCAQARKHNVITVSSRYMRKSTKRGRAIAQELNRPQDNCFHLKFELGSPKKTAVVLQHVPTTCCSVYPVLRPQGHASLDGPTLGPSGSQRRGAGTLASHEVRPSRTLSF